MDFAPRPRLLNKQDVVGKKKMGPKEWIKVVTLTTILGISATQHEKISAVVTDLMDDATNGFVSANLDDLPPAIRVNAAEEAGINLIDFGYDENGNLLVAKNTEEEN